MVGIMARRVLIAPIDIAIVMAVSAVVGAHFTLFLLVSIRGVLPIASHVLTHGL